MRRTIVSGLVAASTMSLLGACSTLTSATGPSATPTTADAALVGRGVQTSVESSIASFLGGVALPTQRFSRSGSAAAMPLLRLAHVPFDLARGSSVGRSHVVGIRGAPPCLSFAPASPTDADGDGILDTVTVTADQNCTFTSDTVTYSLSGSMVLGDPTPTTPDADYTAAVHNLTIGLSLGGDSATLALNGTAAVTETVGTLTENNQMTMTIKSTGIDTVNASFAQNWLATFTFSGGSLVGSGALPAGTLDVTGTTSLVGNGKTFVLEILTPTALTFDPSCTTPSQVTAGTVLATFSGTAGAAYVTLSWNGCQSPAMTFVSGH